MHHATTATLADLLQMQRQQLQTCRRAGSMPRHEGRAAFAGPATAADLSASSGPGQPQYASSVEMADASAAQDN